MKDSTNRQYTTRHMDHEHPPPYSPEWYRGKALEQVARERNERRRMKTFHGDQAVKDKLLARIAIHEEMDANTTRW